MLCKDVCGQDPVTVLGLLRAVQMGILSDKDLDVVIDNRGQGVDIPAVLAALKVKLPNFNKV